jgi:hypothetical protein
MKQGILRSALNTHQRLELTYRQPVGFPGCGVRPVGPTTSQVPAGTANKS